MTPSSGKARPIATRFIGPQPSSCERASGIEEFESRFNTRVEE
ncbi:MAG: hypothetical protein R3B96_14375 [Pirellulaceae bacterium]